MKQMHARFMVELSPQMEKRLLEVVPIVTEWAKKEVKFTDAKLAAFYKIYPDVYEWARITTYDEIMAFILKYENDRLIGPHMKVLLSPKGRAYVRYLMRLAREWEPHMVQFHKYDNNNE